MPPNYQNSLGWLDLQLRADRLKQQQQQDFQREQMTREQSQQDIQNALAVAKHREAARTSSEDRKLQLAAMLQKAAEDRALREQLAEKSDVRIRRGQDLTNEDRDLGRGLGFQRLEENAKQFEARLAQVERIAATKAMTDRDATGQPTANVDPKALVAGVSPPAPPPSDVIRFTPGERTKAQEDFRKAQAMLPTINEYTSAFQNLKPEDFDAAKAQQVPVVGGALKTLGLPASGEDLQRERVNKSITGSLANFFLGEPPPEDAAQVKRKAAFTSAAQKFKSDYARLVSGLTVTEQEQRRLDEITAKINDSQFENNPEFQAAAINQFVQTYNEILANQEADLQAGGSRLGRRAYQVGLPGAAPQATPTGRREPPPELAPGPLSPVNPGPTTAPPSGPRRLPQDPMQRFKAILEANPGMSDEDAYRLATDPGADIGQ